MKADESVELSWRTLIVQGSFVFLTLGLGTALFGVGFWFIAQVF